MHKKIIFRKSNFIDLKCQEEFTVLVTLFD